MKSLVYGGWLLSTAVVFLLGQPRSPRLEYTYYTVFLMAEVFLLEEAGGGGEQARHLSKTMGRFVREDAIVIVRVVGYGFVMIWRVARFFCDCDKKIYRGKIVSGNSWSTR